MLLKSTINETFNKAGRGAEQKCSSRKKGGTMGKKDVVSKIYLGAADRIADLLNNELFEGGIRYHRAGQRSGEYTKR